MLSEEELTRCRSAELRFYQARYYRELYSRGSGPPQDSYFAMIAHLDAFLWALGSIHDLCTSAEKQGLNNSEVFLFLLGLRHATTHQGVIAAPVHGKLPVRPFSRVLDESGNQATGALRIEIDTCEQVLDAAAANYPHGRQGYEAAKRYLAVLRRRGDPRPVIDASLDDGLRVAQVVLGIGVTT